MHRIEILRARYVLQLLVGYIVTKFQPKIPTYMSRRIFLSLFKKANFGHYKTSPKMIKKLKPSKFQKAYISQNCFESSLFFKIPKFVFFSFSAKIFQKFEN